VFRQNAQGDKKPVVHLAEEARCEVGEKMELGHKNLAPRWGEGHTLYEKRKKSPLIGVLTLGMVIGGKETYMVT